MKSEQEKVLRAATCWERGRTNFRKRQRALVLLVLMDNVDRKIENPDWPASLFACIWPLEWSNVDITIERANVTSYLRAIIIYARSVIIYEMFTVEVRMTLTLTFVKGQGQCKCDNRKSIQKFLFDGNSNVCRVCHLLRDIHFGYVSIVSVYDDSGIVALSRWCHLRDIHLDMCQS